MNVFIVTMSNGEEEYITASNQEEAMDVVRDILDKQDPMGLINITEAINSHKSEEEFYASI